MVSHCPEVGWEVHANSCRSDNCVKNHFYSKLRKSVRRLNKLISERFRREYKEIKISSVYKIL